MAADTEMTEGYASIVTADKWFAARGITGWADATRDDRVGALVRAADWLDRQFRFRGQPVQPNQPRAWPRLGVSSGLTSGLGGGSGAAPHAMNAPTAVVEANLELALALLESDVAGEQLLGLSAPISHERIGNLSVSYANSKTMRPTRLHRMLMPYLEPVARNRVVRT